MHKRLSNTHFGFGSVMSLELPMPELGVEMPESSDLPERATPPAEPKQKFRDAVVSRLTSTRADTAELRQRRAVLIGEAVEGEVSLAAVDAFIEESERRDLAAIEKAHADIRKKGQEQLALVEQLGVKHGEALVEWNRLRVERDETQFRFKVAVERRKNLGQFASDVQIQNARIRVAEARKANEDAWNTFSAAMSNMNSCGSELEAAKAELNRIREQEQRLRAEKLGERYRDPELGLEVTAQGGAN